MKPMDRAASAARSLYRAQQTRERADERIRAAHIILRVAALQERTNELRVGNYVVTVGEDVSVIEVVHVVDQLELC